MYPLQPNSSCSGLGVWSFYGTYINLDILCTASLAKPAVHDLSSTGFVSVYTSQPSTQVGIMETNSTGDA